jgi:predicted short-subunit dehydrogenase-like oxidoreductase (DUF2520 family)
MIESVRVIGARGRVGGAVSARLAGLGLLSEDEAEVVLVCVPDRAIREVAAGIAPGPWVAHVSGASPLSALEPHAKRFSLHPLQTFTRDRGPEQLDGAWAALSADDAEGLALAGELATALGLRPFALDDANRVLYHAGAVVAGPFIVTLWRTASALVAAAGAPPEALIPLMRRVIDNDFALTGPVDRQDWETIDRHVEAIRHTAPELEAAYAALVELTAAQAGVSREVAA